MSIVLPPAKFAGVRVYRSLRSEIIFTFLFAAVTTSVVCFGAKSN
jgi:hypothetical protein